MFHVTSCRNRDSIRANGLDWSRMAAAPGIAGSRAPEVEGVFVCDTPDVDFFVRLNNTGGPVDVWAVDEVDERDLIESGNGFSYLPYRIAPSRLTLVHQDLLADDAPIHETPSAYRSSLTISFDDGSVLSGDAARDFISRAQD